jgi:hypothetical protein
MGGGGKYFGNKRVNRETWYFSNIPYINSQNNFTETSDFRLGDGRFIFPYAKGHSVLRY